MPSRAVQVTPEFERVRDLPVRTVGASWEAWARDLSNALRSPWGTMTLRPIQARALYEFATMGGGFGAIGVGQGKTLLTLLLPVVMQAVRPMLLIPAHLRHATERARTAMAYHWRVARHLRIDTYQRLSHHRAADELMRYRPDLLILDEAHKAKNARAAITRRLRRYLDAYPDTKVVVMSGTMVKRSLKDFAHLLTWALRRGAPVTRDFGELMDWADALDDGGGTWFGGGACDPGALLLFTRPEDWDQTDDKGAVRRGYRRRMSDTMGVVMTDTSTVDSTLSVRAEVSHVSAAVHDAFRILRTMWELPDGQLLMDGFEVWRHAMTLGLGFYYRWNPRPPADWLNPRRTYAQAVREVLTTNRSGLDTERQVRDSILKGERPEHADALAAWLRVRDTFRPTSEAVWLDYGPAQAAARWALDHKRGLVWSEHGAFGRAVASIAGIPYFGQKGLTDQGAFIEDHRGPCVLSRQANSEGRNLQGHWQDNLIACHPTTGLATEQLYARTHRDGQDADEVTVEVMLGCVEHWGALEQARMDAKVIEQITGQPQKMGLATIDAPSADEIMSLGGWAWKG